jgi:hypothetical protein
MTLLTTAGFPATAGPLVTTQIISDYQQTVSLRNTGETIGTAGALFFGVGPAIQSGVPRGVDVNDYFPTHAASGSFM